LVSDLKPTVAVVILNWNGRKYLEQFLPSVLAYSAGAELIVADNASTDDSISFLRAHYPAVRIIKFSENYGFCEGYNKALFQIKADYFVLLNSDIEVTPHWLEPIIALMETNPGIAACQPKIKSFYRRNFFEYAGAGGGYLDFLGYPFCRGRLFETLEEDKGQYNDVVPVFWATGACMFVRAKAYQEAGGLEPAFFAHMEEIDLCWRLQRMGYTIMYCGHSEVYHVGGGTLPKSNPRKTYLNFRNGLAMLYKNIPPAQVIEIFFIRIILDWVAALKFLANGDYKDAQAVFIAHRDVWQNRKYLQAQKRKLSFSEKKLKGFYHRSIVLDYFINRKTTFRALNIPDCTSLPAQTFPDIHPKSQH